MIGACDERAALTPNPEPQTLNAERICPASLLQAQSPYIKPPGEAKNAFGFRGLKVV